MKKLFYLLLTMLLLATSLLAGCGNNTQESAKKNGQLHIVTSFYPMYIATANITKGVEGVQLTNMTKPQTGCLHDYQLTTDDMKTLEKADVFVANGAGMESFLDKVIKEHKNLTVIDASKDISLLEENGQPNPHVWLDVDNAIKQVENISQQLCSADPNHAEAYKANAEKKRALIEKAVALKDSTEWRSTSDKLIALQKEWKKVGPVPRKQGDLLWEEFLAACNHFFEARNAAGAGQRGEEYSNLEKKQQVIARLEALLDAPQEGLQEEVQKLTEEYNSIGHVPYKEKDAVYEAYHAALDKVYKVLNVTAAKRRLNNYKNKIKTAAEQDGGSLDGERARLMRQYENIKQEVQTYENNLGFLNASSKKGNSLIDEMNRKVQKLKDEMNLVREKIKAIDASGK